MKIVVTGGIGSVGTPLVQRLIQNGHEVKIIDRRGEGEVAGAELSRCDITDFEAIKGQLKGQDAIIHLAGLPYPGAGTGPEIFRINASGTYNLFEAAAQAGIKRVVCASSINALGFNFGLRRFPIQYFPIDEDHPGVTTDPYSFSKDILEQIAAYYWRRDGITSICFRLPWVYQKSMVDMWMGKEFFSNYRKVFEQIASLPKRERDEQMRQLITWHDGLRSQRAFEQSWEDSGPEMNWQQESTKLLMFFGWTDFWAVISGEDSAQAFEKAVTAKYEGSHILYVHEYRNAAGIEAERLAEVFFPEVITRKRPLRGTECLVDMTRAQQMIDFEPIYSLIKLVSEQTK